MLHKYHINFVYFGLGSLCKLHEPIKILMTYKITYCGVSLVLDPSVKPTLLVKKPTNRGGWGEIDHHHLEPGNSDLYPK